MQENENKTVSYPGFASHLENFLPVASFAVPSYQNCTNANYSTSLFPVKVEIRTRRYVYRHLSCASCIIWKFLKYSPAFERVVRCRRRALIYSATEQLCLHTRKTWTGKRINWRSTFTRRILAITAWHRGAAELSIISRIAGSFIDPARFRLIVQSQIISRVWWDVEEKR